MKEENSLDDFKTLISSKEQVTAYPHLPERGFQGRVSQTDLPGPSRPSTHKCLLVEPFSGSLAPSYSLVFMAPLF